MSMRWPLMTLCACLAASVACCAPQAAEPPPAPENEAANVHPVSGLEVIPLTVTQDGKEHRFRVEVAKTDAEQSQGLMFRTEMGPDEGMLFPTERPQARSFWMKNTVIPLDLLFIGPDGLISNIAANAVPYSLEPIPSSGAAIAVLELNGGRAAELGIEPGARVTW
jgi:uncharacterized membrane protein (UPF0127 family)